MSQALKDQSNQSVALGKVTLADNHNDRVVKEQKQEIANLVRKIEIISSKPPAPSSYAAINTEAETILKLTGPPSDREIILEQEVDNLMGDKVIAAKQKAADDAKVQGLNSDLDKAVKEKSEAIDLVKKTTATLYKDQLMLAQDDMSKSFVFHIMEGVLAFVVLMIVLRLFFAMTTTGAAIAAKIP